MSKEAKTGPGPAARRSVAAILVASPALFAGMALSIPYVYESQTLWYKLGYEKTLLRSGQMAGLAAAVAIMVQLLLGVRGRLLEAVFGVAHLVRWHRANGLLLAAFAVLHVTLVLQAEELPNFLDVGVWPELVGLVLITAVLVMVVTSYYRPQLGLAFPRWRLLHRLLACAVPVLLAVHVLFVCDSFARGVPRIGLLVALSILAATLLGIKGSAWRRARR